MEKSPRGYQVTHRSIRKKHWHHRIVVLDVEELGGPVFEDRQIMGKTEQNALQDRGATAPRDWPQARCSEDLELQHAVRSDRQQSFDGKQDVDDKVWAENERTQPPITNRVRIWSGKCLLYQNLEEKHIEVHEADRQAILEETAKLVTEASMEATTEEKEAAEKSKAVAGLVTEAVERSVLPLAMHCDTAEWHECFIVAKMKSNTLLES